MQPVKSILPALPVLFVFACAAPQLRDVDEAQGTCVLQDGRSGPYVAPKVSEAGAHPRLQQPPPAGTPASSGAYDCLVSTSGEVDQCRVLKSVPGADEFATGALATWRFEPASCAGEAVPGRIVVTLTPRYIPRCGKDPKAFLDGWKTFAVSEAVARAKRFEEEFGQGQHPFAVRLPDGGCVTSDGREGKMPKPKLLNQPPITFSKVAFTNGQRGSIGVRCVLRASGRLEACELACSDTPANEGAMLRDLQAWQMSPPRCGDEPVDLIFDVPFRFTIGS